ncbi:hypothetical protein IJ425_05990 [bacterium]|nr:hypothetical protein [bacterium]
MNKKILILLFVLIISFLFLKQKTISIKKYLNIHPKDWNQITTNRFGFIRYGNKIILKNNFIPLTRNTAKTTIEIKIILAAEKIQPKENCDPSDTQNNGTMGCYINTNDSKN